MKLVLLIFFARISLFLVPHSFVSFIAHIKNSIVSIRFALRVDTSGRVLLHTPFYVKGHKYIKVGNEFTAGPGFRIECWDSYCNETYTPSITIGDNVSFNYWCHVGAIDKIVIGNNVLVGSNVLITDHSHGDINDIKSGLTPAKRPLRSKGPVIIEDNVWIGENVSILPNVTIGEGTIIGANSVVTKNVPKNCIVGGNPAKVIKIRS